MALELTWSPDALRDLSGLDAGQARRIIAGVERFAQTGHGDVKRLKGSRDLRLRVGDYRVFLDVVRGNAIVLHVSNRREAYR